MEEEAAIAISRTRRRALLKGAAAVAAWPACAFAQTAGRSYRLCWLSSGPPITETYNVAFVRRLRELGFVEGRNLAIDYRSAEGRADRLKQLAADLARQRCDVYMAPGTEANLKAIELATRDVPIVTVATDFDPVARGYVANLARPGGRITGMSHLQSELPAKRLELMKELLPSARKIAVLSDVATGDQLALTQAAAKRLDMALVVHEFGHAPYPYDAAFAELARARPDALLALASGIFATARKTIPALALQYRMPSMFNNGLWAEAGGLISYGVSFATTYRRAAEQVAMIFNGAKPGDIPMEQATAVELVVNLRTAKALRVAVPPSVLVRADRVIE